LLETQKKSRMILISTNGLEADPVSKIISLILVTLTAKVNAPKQHPILWNISIPKMSIKWIIFLLSSI
jgi:hypothetical protein